VVEAWGAGVNTKWMDSAGKNDWGQFPHFGQGVMDFKAIIDTLKQVGYSGFVSIEQDKHPGDMKETCRRYLQLMRECIG
jgi:sugar phosphate isomerase/epimerase